MKNDNTTVRRRLFRRADALVYLLLLALAFGYMHLITNRQTGDAICRVIYNRETYVTLSLAENARFFLDVLPQVEIEVKDGRIAFIHSDCPDKVCVNTGFIGTPGQSAACLPNRVILIIEGNFGVDATVG